MTHSFDPAGEPLAFRHALGAFATGVCVVTTIGPDGPVGMTINSFASVSLDPPLVLWSALKSSGRYAAFAGAENFAINVLTANQRDIAAGFTRPGDAFEGLDWTLSDKGMPLVDNALAAFECRLEAQHEGGDHTILIGHVLRAHHGTGAPLVFQGGSFGGFSTGD